METTSMSFAQAMKHFFGSRTPESTSADFIKEIRALDDADKAYFRQHLTAAGYVLTP